MKTKSSKTSKTVASKKEKTGSTKVKKSRTPSKRSTSRTSSYWVSIHASNLKGTYHTATGESWSVYGDVTPNSTCVFFFHETTPSGKEHARNIRIGPKGLEYLGPSDGEYRTIGWDELDDPWGFNRGS